MLDIQHIPSLDNPKFQVFFSSDTTTWQRWSKPKICSFVHILIVGGGGGGASGQSAAAGSTKYGGSGGGSSGIFSLLTPANLIPDTLYFRIGRGGAGAVSTGGSTQIGGTGTPTTVATRPSSTTTDFIFMCNAGTGASTTAGGSLGTVVSYDLVDMMLSNSTTGQAGANRLTTNTPGASITATIPVTSGAAGASIVTTGAWNNGGNIITPIVTIPGGNTEGADGTSGFSQMPSFDHIYPFFTTGGGGGASSTVGRGGRGGDGGFGSGGGGGGASTGTATGANGGRGGDGIAIVTCY